MAGKKLIEADTVIHAFGMKPNTELVDLIKLKYGAKTRQIGDSVSVAQVGEAVRSGFFAGLTV